MILQATSKGAQFEFSSHLVENLYIHNMKRKRKEGRGGEKSAINYSHPHPTSALPLFSKGVFYP